MSTSRIGRRTTRRPEGHLTAAARSSQTAVGREAVAARVRCPRPLRAVALVAVAWTLWPAMICAQDGALDTSFGVGGIRILLFSSGGDEHSEAYDLALRADGKIVVAGSVNISGNTDFGIAQLEPDGDDDTSFGDRGRALVPFDYGWPNRDSGRGVALDSLGRIVVAGRVESLTDGIDDFGVARLWGNGALDSSTFNFPWGKVAIPFDLGGAGSDICRGVVVQPDGKIVLAGSVQVGTDDDFGVARLTVDGSLDGSFGGGDGKSVIPFEVASGFNDLATDVALQPDGRIVVVGYVDVLESQDFGVTRLLPDGIVDSSFGQSPPPGRVVIPFDLETGREDEAWSVAIQPDGRILVAGFAERVVDPEVPQYDFAVARLRPDGELDPDFGTDGKVVVPSSLGTRNAYDIAIQQDGKILLAGSGLQSGASFGHEDFTVVRLLPDGSLDPSFGNGGIVVLPVDLTPDKRDYASAVALQSDGKILLAGRASATISGSTYSYFVVARLLNGLAIFSDGFESGDTSAWSRTVP